MRQYMGRKPVKLGANEQAFHHEKVLQGAAASQLAEFAEEVLIRGQEKSIRSLIFAQIDSEEPLDPVKAAQAWIELRAAYKLVERLKRVQKAGMGSSSRLDMDPAEDES
jgi:hypothetical protein